MMDQSNDDSILDLSIFTSADIPHKSQTIFARIVTDKRVNT